MDGVTIERVVEVEVKNGKNKFYIETSQAINNAYEIPESLADEIIGMLHVFGRESEQWKQFEAEVLADVIGKAIIEKFAKPGARIYI